MKLKKRKIKTWTDGVPVESEAIKQLENIASLPFIYKWVAAMPDIHVGKGSAVGSVIPTKGAIIPAAVGVDIGCGMMAVQTSLNASRLPDNLLGLRTAIEKAVPHGRTDPRKGRDKGAWGKLPTRVQNEWALMLPEYKALSEKHKRISDGNDANHLGTLGTGNHFIEVCLDESNQLWFMLHSGSRGVGNRIGQYFITLARKDMERLQINLPDKDLAYLEEGTKHFRDYMEAVGWAQNFATINRQLMMQAVLEAAKNILPPFETHLNIVNCHHNYVEKEQHYGQEVFVTRKGAVRARSGDLGIIPGSMGAKSFIVRGLGNAESFHSCSHGAGRKMSRTAARKSFTLADHAAATKGIECRKDEDVLDETPMAYKDIDKVMLAQADLVEIVHTLRQVVVVKG
jgi:tRNA-splicing ligase RtcB (3'-phosphate/5'-hydroxy nucleic acid ligase)